MSGPDPRDFSPTPDATPTGGASSVTAESRTVLEMGSGAAGGGKRRLPRGLRRLLVLLSVLGAVVVVFAGLVAMGVAISTTPSGGEIMAKATPEKGMTKDRLDAKAASLRKKMAALVPKGIHVVVDTAANRLQVRDGERVLREAVVSCGSGNVLPNPKGGKDWVFDTPRGEYTVQVKKKNPIWIKPDWAFVEEGKPVPPRNSSERAEEGVMGDYALGIGNGFFLHGTMYTRLLGRNVTHGCVRIGDDDLKFTFDKVPLGAKVYLF